MRKTEQNQIMQKVWVGLPWTGSVSIHLGSQKERQGIWMQMEMGGSPGGRGLWKFSSDYIYFLNKK